LQWVAPPRASRRGQARSSSSGAEWPFRVGRARPYPHRTTPQPAVNRSTEPNWVIDKAQSNRSRAGERLLHCLKNLACRGYGDFWRTKVEIVRPVESVTATQYGTVDRGGSAPGDAAARADAEMRGVHTHIHERLFAQGAIEGRVARVRRKVLVVARRSPAGEPVSG
jgi:hypothetical protein